MNLRKQVEPLESRASGFLTTEACTPRDVAAHLCVKHRLKRHSEPSRTKQGTKLLTSIEAAAHRVAARRGGSTHASTACSGRPRARRRRAVRCRRRARGGGRSTPAASARARNSSSAILRAAMTAMRSGSALATPRAAARCICSSRNAASAAMYSAPGRCGPRSAGRGCRRGRPWPSASIGSEVELVDLRDHLDDAVADQFALLAQRRGSAEAPRTRRAGVRAASSSRSRRAISSSACARSPRRVSIMPTSWRTFSSSRSMGCRSTVVPVRDIGNRRCSDRRSAASAPHERRVSRASAAHDGLDRLAAPPRRSTSGPRRGTSAARQADLTRRHARALVAIEFANETSVGGRAAPGSCHEPPRQASDHRRGWRGRARPTGYRGSGCDRSSSAGARPLERIEIESRRRTRRRVAPGRARRRRPGAVWPTMPTAPARRRPPATSAAARPRTSHGRLGDLGARRTRRTPRATSSATPFASKKSGRPRRLAPVLAARRRSAPSARRDARRRAEKPSRSRRAGRRAASRCRL